MPCSATARSWLILPAQLLSTLGQTRANNSVNKPNSPLPALALQAIEQFNRGEFWEQHETV
jgi:DNA-binding transcriptional regulator of glucitol operon